MEVRFTLLWGMTIFAHKCFQRQCKGKFKGFPYSIPSDGPGADPGVQAVSPQVTVIHPAVGCHYFPPGQLPPQPQSILAGTKLYCFVTEAHRCEQLAQGCYAALPRAGFELTTCLSQAQTPYPLHHRANPKQADSNS